MSKRPRWPISKLEVIDQTGHGRYLLLKPKMDVVLFALWLSSILVNLQILLND